MFLSKLTWQAYSRLLARPVADIERFSVLNPAGQRQAMAARLLAQIRYFGSREDALPEWREAARVTRPEEIWEIWPSLPIVTKPMLNARFEPVEMQRRYRLRGRISATGGSTGEPTRFFLDIPMLRASRGAHLYSQLKMGWRPGMATIIVWGSDRDIGKQTGWLRQAARYLYRHHMIPGFAISDRSVAEIHEIIRTEAPVAIYGFTSLLEFVAERTLALGQQMAPGRVAVAWNGGEMLYDNQVELFKRAFGVPILNRYGGRELSATAFQEAEGAPLRLVRPWVFLEIVNDAGKPAAPGEIGRLLLTSTISRGTPFLRYDIGDLGSYAEDDRDESGIRNIRKLHGRHSGALRLDDGRIISCLYWNHLLKDYPEVMQFQVRVSRAGRISLLLAGRGFSIAREEQLNATLRLLLRGQQVDLRWIETIPRTAQGKLVQVVQE
jgi:phenylacetate-CoA ligase